MNINLIKNTNEYEDSDSKNLAIKAQFSKKATKTVLDTFKKDQETTDMLTERSKHVDELLNAAKEQNDQYQKLVSQKDELNKVLSETTDENEKEVISQQMAELDGQMSVFQSRMEDNRNQAIGENKSITAIKNELVKGHEMVDSVKTADKLNEAASKQVISEALSDAIETIDEKIDEEMEEAKENQEEQEAKEEEAATQELPEEQSDLQKKMTQLINQKQITEEDLKGLVVDTADLT